MLNGFEIIGICWALYGIGFIFWIKSELGKFSPFEYLLLWLGSFPITFAFLVLIFFGLGACITDWAFGREREMPWDNERK